MTRLFKYSLITLLIIINSVLFWYINFRFFVIEEVFIENIALRKALGDLTIVHISDLHIGTITNYENRVLEFTNSLNPDFVFLTGDLIADTSGIDDAIQFVSRLKPKFVIIFVPGNYDHRFAFGNAPEKLFSGLRNAGVVVLRNSSVKIELSNGIKPPERIYISGVDDLVSTHSDLLLTLSGLEENIPVLLMSHSPKILNRALDYDVDCILSGHTHGGQVYIPYITKRFTKTYYIGSFMKGLHSKGDTDIFINRGLGTSLVPIRFFSLPQIAVLRFTK
ncbi:MAG: hypothetical protein GF315_10185 [candidate division Zixibacteria bacterium]|nr:hypothetical protein [candidate division Zixibacteria bacterium]